ncbi:MAG: PQQ-binding-like beta-propeller repeat protein [Spirochaetales bacterium]|nr:PQQ-binding-like beta-propeller repeat protein [Spirochaetales bacterium]
MIARSILIPSLIFLGIASVLVLATFIQLNTVKPLDSPALLELKMRAKDNPEDAQLKEEIRAFDLLVRKAYFTSVNQVATGGYVILFFAAVCLVCILVIVTIERKYGKREMPYEKESKVRTFRITRSVLIGFGITAVTAVLAIVMVLVFIMNTETGNQDAEGTASIPISSPETNESYRNEYESNWPGFRGPYGNGRAYTSDAPVEWDGETGKGILWKITIEGDGMNSPVVWGNRVFYSTGDERKKVVHCVDADTGAVLWNKELSDIKGSPETAPKVGPDTGYAAPTCAVNGRVVTAIFANGDMAAFDFDGRQMWGMNLGPSESMYGYSSSLLAYDAAVYIQYDQNETQKILSLNADTGSLLWETKRNVAPSWASPALTPDAARIILNATPIVACYEAATGKELWSVDCMFGDMAPSPTSDSQTVFVAMENAVGAAISVDTGSIIFEKEDDLPNVTSPLLTEKHIYYSAGYGFITCLDRKEGTVLWTREFEEGFYASPIMVGERIYYLDRKGTMHIFKDGPEYTFLGEPELGEDSVCTPAFQGGRIYIRTLKNLYCIGSK